MGRSVNGKVVPAVVLALTLAGTLIAHAKPAKKPPPTAVSVVVVAPQPVYQQQSYIGRIKATRVINLVARITGYLEQRLFHQGGTVTKGQVLFVIEPGPYQAAFDQANAAVAAAQATLDNARITLSRAQALLHTPAGRRSTLDDARATAQTDAANLAAAKAQRETAAINLSYTQIRAPINGRIGASNINIGNVVSPTTGTLATVVTQNPVDVLFSLPVRDAITLRDKYATKGGLDALELRLRLPDGHMDRATGKLLFTSNQISSSTDSLALEGSIPNPVIKGMGSTRANNRELTSGEFVTVILRSKHPVQQIVLPRDAVLADQLGDYVLALNPHNVVIRQSVKLSQSTAATATIASGVAPGNRLIINGIEKVHPGQTVTPQTVPNPTAKA